MGLEKRGEDHTLHIGCPQRKCSTWERDRGPERVGKRWRGDSERAGGCLLKASSGWARASPPQVRPVLIIHRLYSETGHVSSLECQPDSRLSGTDPRHCSHKASREEECRYSYSGQPLRAFRAPATFRHPHHNPARLALSPFHFSHRETETHRWRQTWLSQDWNRLPSEVCSSRSF